MATRATSCTRLLWVLSGEPGDWGRSIADNSAQRTKGGGMEVWEEGQWLILPQEEISQLCVCVCVCEGMRVI